MQHSVKKIGDDYERISIMRKDKVKFSSNDFFEFADKNRKKYNIIENADDLLVSTWYSDGLVEDYKSTINNFK